MKIGQIDLGNRPVMLAPMEDVTDLSFRQICREQGADMVYTEFVSADALIRNIQATLRKLNISDAERPAAIQIYGREVEPMVEAAKMCAEVNPDVIDLNFGCPVKKVAGKGAGSGLLRNVPLMCEITRAVVNAVNVPVTAKPASVGTATPSTLWKWQSSCKIAVFKPSPSMGAPVVRCTPVKPTGR